MSDFYGALSSTSFRVKDTDAFENDPDVQIIQAIIACDKPALNEIYPGGFFKRNDGYWAFGWTGQYPQPQLTYYNDPDSDDPDESNLDVSCMSTIRLVGKTD